jgi:hypothetical protein
MSCRGVVDKLLFLDFGLIGTYLTTTCVTEVLRIFCKKIHAMNRTDLVNAMFLLYCSIGVIFMKRCFYKCYANDLHNTACCGVVDHCSRSAHVEHIYRPIT